LGNALEKFEGTHVRLDPVMQVLIRCGVSKGVVGGAQHRHKHGSRFGGARVAGIEGNLRSGPIHKQFFARPVFLPQNEILHLLPATVQFAKTAVAVTTRLLGAILLPKQLQREVRMLPEFVLQGDKVRHGPVHRTSGTPASIPK
jgi:hypothetical protein